MGQGDWKQPQPEGKGPEFKFVLQAFTAWHRVTCSLLSLATLQTDNPVHEAFRRCLLKSQIGA